MTYTYYIPNIPLYLTYNLHIPIHTYTYLYLTYPYLLPNLPTLYLYYNIPTYYLYYTIPIPIYTYKPILHMKKK